MKDGKMLQVGKLKLVISNGIGGSLVIASDTVAGLKEGYYEVKLSQLDCVRRFDRLVDEVHERKAGSLLELHKGVLASDDITVLESSTEGGYLTYGNVKFQILCSRDSFEQLAVTRPKVFNNSHFTDIALGISSKPEISTAIKILNKAKALKAGLKVIANPLDRLSLFEYAIRLGCPISDDTKLISSKREYYLASHKSEMIKL